MDKNFINKKLEFLAGHIELLKEYRDCSSSKMRENRVFSDVRDETD